MSWSTAGLLQHMAAVDEEVQCIHHDLGISVVQLGERHTLGHDGLPLVLRVAAVCLVARVAVEEVSKALGFGAGLGSVIVELLGGALVVPENTFSLLCK